MTVAYKPVLWNASKIRYDLALIAAIAAYILVFERVAPAFQDVTLPVEPPIYEMRAWGSCAFLLLTVVLCIGPLARLDRRFLPLLYNRRHLGVATFTVAVVHLTKVLDWYTAFSPANRYVALLGSNTSYGQVLGFPFEAFGIAALLILAALAFTSHDFWLSFLTPPVWKAIHMGVYAAYTLVVAHVSLGALQAQDNPLLAIVVTASVVTVAGLHFAAGRRERRRDRTSPPPAEEDGWLDIGTAADFEEGFARIAALPDGERVAIYRHGGGKLSAVSNVCTHQNGPLGEGKIVGGCITCPWHGFQFRPEDGRAPAPFTDMIATFNLKRAGARVLLDPRPNPPGTYVTPLDVADAPVAEGAA